MYIKSNFNYLLRTHSTNTNMLSKELDIYESSLRRLKVGVIKNPSIETVIKICQHFNISIDDFVFKDLCKEGNKYYE